MYFFDEKCFAGSLCSMTQPHLILRWEKLCMFWCSKTTLTAWYVLWCWTTPTRISTSREICHAMCCSDCVCHAPFRCNILTNHLSNVYNDNDISYCKTNPIRLDIPHDQICHKMYIFVIFFMLFSFLMPFVSPVAILLHCIIYL